MLESVTGVRDFVGKRYLSRSEMIDPSSGCNIQPKFGLRQLNVKSLIVT
jgi:hypothetical protein